MIRAAVIQRIESLTDAEFERVAPDLEADLDAALGYRDFVKGKVQAGIESGAGGASIGLDEARAHFAARRKARAESRAR